MRRKEFSGEKTILSVLKYGDVLTARQIGERCDLKRSSIKETLRRLADKGLVLLIGKKSDEAYSPFGWKIAR
jgi:DNA-binding GntR family transcriptional regulator